MPRLEMKSLEASKVMPRIEMKSQERSQAFKVGKEKPKQKNSCSLSGCLSRVWTCFNALSTLVGKPVDKIDNMSAFFGLVYSPSSDFPKSFEELQSKGKSYTTLDLTKISKDPGAERTHMDIPSNVSKLIPGILKHCPNLKTLKAFSGDLPYATHCELLKHFPVVTGCTKTTTYSVCTY